MKYHAYIEIDNFEVITKKTLEFIVEHNNVNRIGFYWLPWDEYVIYCPEIMTAFSRYNINPVAAATITTASLGDSRIHVDAVLQQCRINLPILNCEGSKTEFYSGGEYNTLYTAGSNIPYHVIKKDDTSAIKVDEVEITKPTVVRVLAPHYVRTNVNTVPRISMSIQFDVDPVFLLE